MHRCRRCEEVITITVNETYDGLCEPCARVGELQDNIGTLLEQVAHLTTQLEIAERALELMHSDLQEAYASEGVLGLMDIQEYKDQAHKETQND